jgi:uncharacterized protein (TIGR02145 family)
MAKKLNLIGVFVAGLIFTSTMSGCGEVGCNPAHDSWCEDGGSSVTYGGQTYKTVKIGNQTWFAENLNYKANGSKCYGEEGEFYDYESDTYFTLSDAEVQANCGRYGRLYDWSTAITACPSGWHLPSDAEWTTLTDYVGGANNTAGTKLKAASGWNSSGNGTDEYGFSALPGGDGSSDGSFFNVGNFGSWWSATEYDASYAYYRDMGYGGSIVDRSYFSKSYLFSVRCLQD